MQHICASEGWVEEEEEEEEEDKVGIEGDTLSGNRVPSSGVTHAIGLFLSLSVTPPLHPSLPPSLGRHNCYRMWSV
jgi:hypothetical protein